MKTKTYILTTTCALFSAAVLLFAQTPNQDTQKNMPMMKEMMKDKAMMREMCKEMMKDPESMKIMCEEMMKDEKAWRMMCENMMKNDKCLAVCQELSSKAQRQPAKK